MNKPVKWPSMKVELVIRTPVVGCCFAMRATRGEGPSWIVAGTSASEDALRSHCLIPGHYSVIEFCWFCFHVSGISRICSHELVRHRHLSFAQESTRVVKDREYITMPPDCWAQEHERYDFGGYAATSMLIAGNGRSWVEMLQKRLCERAAPEIRRLAWEIRELLPPLLQEIAVPQCDKCSEESCNFNSR